MNLVDLNSKIHQASKSELESNLNAWKDAIASALSAGDSESYYKNHIGRELCRKLHNFDLNTELASIDPHGYDFRPLQTHMIRQGNRSVFILPKGGGIVTFSNPKLKLRAFNVFSSFIDSAGSEYTLLAIKNEHIQDPNFCLLQSCGLQPNNAHPKNHTFDVASRPEVIALATISGITKDQVYKIGTVDTTDGTVELMKTDVASGFTTKVGSFDGRGSKWEVITKETVLTSLRIDMGTKGQQWIEAGGGQSIDWQVYDS